MRRLSDQLPRHRFERDTSPRTQASPVRGSWASWGRLFEESSVQSSRFNPSGFALRTALAPGVPIVGEANGAQCVRLTSALGTAVDARLFRSRSEAAHNRLIIGFHGNGTTADGMAGTWRDLARFGRVLAVNIPGYGDTPAPTNGARLEVHMAAGVQAAADFALQTLRLAPGAVTWYGLSLGGTQAAMGFSMLPGSHLILHNTLTGPEAVAAEVLERQVGSMRPLAQGLASIAGRSAFVRGLRHPGLRYETDGLDTLGKLRRCRETHGSLGSRLLVVGAERDEIMGSAFPAQLAQAYYGSVDAAADNLYVMPGAGHNAPIAGTAARRLDAFMAA